MWSPSLLVTISYYSIPSGMLGRGPHTLSKASSRLPPAYAPASLRLPAAADARRSAVMAPHDVLVISYVERAAGLDE